MLQPTYFVWAVLRKVDPKSIVASEIIMASCCGGAVDAASLHQLVSSEVGICCVGATWGSPEVP